MPAIRLVELRVDSQTVATGVYNGDGDLVSVTVLDVTTTYVRDWASPEKPALVETTGTDATYNLQGLGLVAQQLPGGEVQYLLYDGMRSVRQIVDEQGNVTYTQTFDPYGGVYESFGTGSSDYGFMGLLGLEDSPLLYYDGQWYHTGIGRFLSPVPGLPNPYVPPLGLGMGLIGIGLLLSPRLRKKKGWRLLMMLMLVGSVGIVLVACGGEEQTPTPTPTLPGPRISVPTADMPAPPTSTHTSAPSPTPYSLSDTEYRALVLAVFQETQGDPTLAPEVVLHVMANRRGLPEYHTPYYAEMIDNTDGPAQIADGVLGTSGTPGDFCAGCSLEDRIYNAYEGFRTSPTPAYAAAFSEAQRLVDEFLRNPSEDPTGGAIHFVHADSIAEAEAIAERIRCLGEDWVRRQIADAGVLPITNPPGYPMVVGSMGRAVYINMNYTPPQQLRLYPVPLSCSD